MLNKLNNKIALKVTALVGTMVCAYIFSLIALISLPSAIKSHNVVVIIGWLSSNFLQLVLLPILLVGQNKHHSDIKKIHDHLGLS